MSFVFSKGDQCKSAVAALHKNYPESERPSLIEAAHLCREKQTNQAIEVLKVRNSFYIVY